jgi:hypothetical protein
MAKRFLLVLMLFMFISCSRSVVVMVPPRIDLTAQPSIGLISFSVENAKGELDEMATQRFLQAITQHQGGVQIIELGKIDEVLNQVNKSTLDQNAIRAIGERFNVTSFFYGKISVSDVKPQVSIGALIKSMSVRASFNMSVTSRLYSTESGRTMWTDSVYRKGSLANIGLMEGKIPHFSMQDKDEAFMVIIEQMMYDLSRDFRPTAQRVRKQRR